MQRVLNTVIGLAIVVIAASVAAILYLMAGLTIWEAGWVGLAVMLALVIVSLVRERAADRALIRAQIEDLAKASAKVTRELTLLHSRVVDLEDRDGSDMQGALQPGVDDARADDLEQRIGDLEALNRTLVDTLAAMKRQQQRTEQTVRSAAPVHQSPRSLVTEPPLDAEHATDEVSPAEQASGRVRSEPRLVPVADTDDHFTGPDHSVAALDNAPLPLQRTNSHRTNGAEPRSPARNGGHPRDPELELESAIANGKVDGGNRPDFYALERSAPFKTLSDASLGALVEKAVRSGRVEIMLQPIVTLPQRKVRFYEAFARLRTSDGVLMQPGDFLDYAKRNGLMPEIDRQVVRRAVHVARRLISRSRDVGVFVNLDVHSLSDSDAASDVVAYLDSNRALSPSLIFEMTQDAYGRAGPLERALLEQITELGFRLSLDQVQRLDLDAKALADGKVRFAKVAAAHLLGGGDLTRDIHVADLSDLLARSGISLIAGHVEREAEVVDLLDYDVGFAQGFLFSPPRPVRGEGAPPDRAAAEPERVQRGASALAASRA